MDQKELSLKVFKLDPHRVMKLQNVNTWVSWLCSLLREKVVTLGKKEQMCSREEQGEWAGGGLGGNTYMS